MIGGEAEACRETCGCDLDTKQKTQYRPPPRALEMAARSAVASRNSRRESVGGENFKVAVRVRPLIEREIRSSAALVS